MSTAYPFLIEDMAAFLLACTAEPVRVRRADFDLYARDRARIERALAPIDDELLGLAEFTRDVRLDQARSLLGQLGFIEVEGDLSGGPVLATTDRGRRWMGLEEAARDRAILDRFRPLTSDGEDELDDDLFDVLLDAGEDDRDGFGGAWEIDDDAFDLLLDEDDGPDVYFGLFPNRGVGLYLGQLVTEALEPAAVEALRSLAVDSPTPLAGFLERCVVHDNPLDDPEIQSRFYFQFRHAEADMRTLWGGVLTEILLQRLIPLGAVAVGWSEEDEPFVELTSAGRYLLGLDADLPDPVAAGSGAVRVQADFEVVFLAPAPAVERAIDRFAERLGTGVGTLFRLTPESVRVAAAAGMNEGSVLGTLRTASAGELPANVEREIRGWMGSSRRLPARTTLVIDCGDEETAARVAAAGGAKLRPIGDALVEAREGRLPPALVRKLAAAGIFVDTASVGQDGAGST